MDTEIFYNRRCKLLHNLAEDAVIILATNQQNIRSNDVTFNFRANSNFYYLTGFKEPNALIILSADSYIIFLQKNNKKQQLWDGNGLGIEKAKDLLGADYVFDINTIYNKLPQLLQSYQQVLFDFNNIKHLGISNILSIQPYESLSEKILNLRLIKDNVEIFNIKKAINITAIAHNKTMKELKKYNFEYHIFSVFAQVFAYHNVECAYPAIVAGGKNANILHYTKNNQKLKMGDLVLIDAACEYNLYASDITRTLPLNGKFSNAQKHIYNIVLDAQKQAIDSIKIGVPINTPHIVATRIIKKGLTELKILTKNHNIKDFFMHGTSHFLGLDVHDPCAYKANGKYRLFANGMVLTVEPGIYIQPSNNVDIAYHNIGIRIEDNILVTKNGAEVLSKMIPKEITDITRMMQ